MEFMLLMRFSNFLVEVVVVLIAVAVAVAVNVLVAAVEAVTDTMIVPIKYERSGGGFFKLKSRANLELFSNFWKKVFKLSWRFQNLELENNSGFQFY